MSIRFEVNQAEAFRRGVDCPKSIVNVDVNPASLDATTRELIAKRMNGIDVCCLSSDGAIVKSVEQGFVIVRADLPTLAALIAAVEKNEAEINPSFRAASLEDVEARLEKSRKEREASWAVACRRKSDAESAARAAMSGSTRP